MSRPRTPPAFFQEQPPTQPPAAPKPTAPPAARATAGGWEVVQRMIDDAVKAGTHSPEVRTVCMGCREWCDGHYVGKLGRCCAPRPATGASAEPPTTG